MRAFLPFPTGRSWRAFGSSPPLFSGVFFGGLFFTFTSGAALSIFTLGAVWMWHGSLSRNRYFSALFLIIWLGGIVGVNNGGFNPLATSLFITVPAAVTAAALKWRPIQNGKKPFAKGIVFFTPFILLTAFWLLQLDSRMFLNFRDNLFLSNPLGIKINDFYYKYTLYPAEILKSMEQKLIKTCDFESIQDVSLKTSLEKILLPHDYVSIGHRSAADLKILKDGDALVFKNPAKVILRTPIRTFFLQPKTTLMKISLKTDRNLSFRSFTFASLLIGLPLIAYIYLYALFYYLSSCFLDAMAAGGIASVVCFIIGTAILMPAYLEKKKEVHVEALTDALASEDWQYRVAGLKVLLENNMEIADFQPYERIMNSPHIPERYWFVRALGISRKPETYNRLLGFLDDPCPNVVCMVFRSLGQRQDRTAVKEIVHRIKTSDHWYEQWYAYKALRALGWKQTRLN